jgi:hypothetical protein
MYRHIHVDNQYILIQTERRSCLAEEYADIKPREMITRSLINQGLKHAHWLPFIWKQATNPSYLIILISSPIKKSKCMNTNLNCNKANRRRSQPAKRCVYGKIELSNSGYVDEGGIRSFTALKC